LTLLVTIAIAAIAFLQWETFEKTDKTLKAQQRAWLEPQGVTIISGLKAGEALSYQIKFTNVGKEPAINMVLQSEPQYLEVPANNTMSGYFPGKNEWCKKVRPNSEGLVVWPSAPKSIVYSVNTQPDKDILEGRKFLLIEGCFGYETVGENRFSSFCFYTRPSPDLTIDKWPVLSCMNHHNAD
jgi:hypothetical protein